MLESFENKIKTYKENSPKHLQNWKKIKALHHFAQAQGNDDLWETLEMIIRFYLRGWLWKSQESLLDEILNHYKIDYTKWAVKDGWVKMQLINGLKHNPQQQQLEIWFDTLERNRVETRNKSPFYSKLVRYKHIQPRLIT